MQSLLQLDVISKKSSFLSAGDQNVEELTSGSFSSEHTLENQVIVLGFPITEQLIFSNGRSQQLLVSFFLPLLRFWKFLHDEPEFQQRQRSHHANVYKLLHVSGHHVSAHLFYCQNRVLHFDCPCVIGRQMCPFVHTFPTFSAPL